MTIKFPATDEQDRLVTVTASYNGPGTTLRIQSVELEPEVVEFDIPVTGADVTGFIQTHLIDQSKQN